MDLCNELWQAAYRSRMKPLVHLALGAAAALAVTVTTVSSWSTSARLESFLGEIRDLTETNIDMQQSVTTTWTSGGSQVGVTTVRGAEQTVADWVEAHRQAVEALKVAFPEDE